jgi:hypothetical protein
MDHADWTKFSILKISAYLTNGDMGQWVHERWLEYNTRYFENQISPGGIQWGLTPHGSALGYYESGRNLIVLHQSLLKASPFGKGNPWNIKELLGYRLAADVLLHEMIRQSIF